MSDPSEAQIAEILDLMLTKKPENTKVSAANAMQVLTSKLGSNVSSQATFVEGYLENKQKQIAGAKRPRQEEKKEEQGNKTTSESGSESDDSSDDDDDDDSDDDDSDDGSDSSDDESDDEDEDEEDDEEDFDSDDEGEEGEEKEKTADNRGSTTVSKSEDTLSDRITGMSDCARKLGYRPRGIETDGQETSEAYLSEYLIPLFRSKNLDPDKYSSEDVKKYKLLKEIDRLESDGADTSLKREDRKARVNLTPPPAPKPPAFMDDDE